MATFKVLKQSELEREPNAGVSTFRLVVLPIDGQLEPGLEFIGYCTHHPFTVAVRSVEKTGAALLLVCETEWPVYEHLFEEAVINTVGPVRRECFFYDHDNKYGPTSL
jgi:hypothetical protein